MLAARLNRHRQTIMKQILTNILIVTVVAVVIYFLLIRPNYNWEHTIKSQAEKDTLTFLSQDKTWELFRPWTWFVNPVNEIWFTKAGEYGRVDDSTMIGHIYEFKKGADAEKLNFYVFYNCKDHSSHILENADSSLLGNFDSNKVKWYREESSSPTGKIVDYFCSKNKKYTMMDYRGREIDVSNFIINGFYSLKDSNAKYIFELINNKPYMPVSKDNLIISDGIIKWLNEKYPDQKFELEKELYSMAKYQSTTTGFFGNLVDNYQIEISPNQTIGKLKLEFDFSRFSIPADIREKDEIRIHNNE